MLAEVKRNPGKAGAMKPFASAGLAAGPLEHDWAQIARLAHYRITAYHARDLKPEACDYDRNAAAGRSARLRVRHRYAGMIRRCRSTI